MIPFCVNGDNIDTDTAQYCETSPPVRGSLRTENSTSSMEASTANAGSKSSVSKQL